MAFGGRLKQRHYKTWGCGINLTPRMEYTATGFVQPIKRVFSYDLSADGQTRDGVS